MCPEAGIDDELLDQFWRLRLAAQRLKIPADELFALA
jgi:hypothetical protein